MGLFLGGSRCGSGSRAGSCCLAAVDFEFGRPGEFTELVSYHLFSHVDREEFFSVVDSEGESYELGRDIAVASPGFDDFLLAFFDHFRDLTEKSLVDVGAFFE